MFTGSQSSLPLPFPPLTTLAYLDGKEEAINGGEGCCQRVDLLLKDTTTVDIDRLLLHLRDLSA